MTMLVTDRRRSFGARDAQHEHDAWQGSLFAQDTLAPPAHAPGPTPDPFAPALPAPVAEAAATIGEDAPTASAIAPVDAPLATTDALVGAPAAIGADAPSAPVDAPATPRTDAPSAPTGLLAPAPERAEVLEPADYVEDPGELEPAHAHPATTRSLLAGPTLDDIMSRAWEGLRAEVPTPCPVCRTEIEPSAGGRCGGCGSTLD
jgi:hypothetical protein